MWEAGKVIDGPSGQYYCQPNICYDEGKDRATAKFTYTKIPAQLLKALPKRFTFCNSLSYQELCRTTFPNLTSLSLHKSDYMVNNLKEDVVTTSSNDIDMEHSSKPFLSNELC